MNKSNNLTFLKGEYYHYQFLLKDREIQSTVSLFLLKYVSVESFYKKLLVCEMEATWKVLTEKEKKNLRVDVRDVRRVLKYFDITCDNDLIERVFGSNDTNYKNCSIKKLRDRLVHSVNEKSISAIIERYDKIDADLNTFMDQFSLS